MFQYPDYIDFNLEANPDLENPGGFPEDQVALNPNVGWVVFITVTSMQLDYFIFQFLKLDEGALLEEPELRAYDKPFLDSVLFQYRELLKKYWDQVGPLMLCERQRDKELPAGFYVAGTNPKATATVKHLYDTCQTAMDDLLISIQNFRGYDEQSSQTLHGIPVRVPQVILLEKAARTKLGSPFASSGRLGTLKEVLPDQFLNKMFEVNNIEVPEHGYPKPLSPETFFVFEHAGQWFASSSRPKCSVLFDWVQQQLSNIRDASIPEDYKQEMKRVQERLKGVENDDRVGLLEKLRRDPLPNVTRSDHKGLAFGPDLNPKGCCYRCLGAHQFEIVHEFDDNEEKKKIKKFNNWDYAWACAECVASIICAPSTQVE